MKNKDLENRVWALENPPKFKAGDLVYQSMTNERFCEVVLVSDCPSVSNNNHTYKDNFILTHYCYQVLIFVRGGMRLTYADEYELSFDPAEVIKNREYFDNFKKTVSNYKIKESI